MTQRYTCAGYPTPEAHALRANEPGFQDVVSYSDDLPDGPDIPDPSGSLCLPCYTAKQLDDANNQSNQAAERTAMIYSIRNRLVNGSQLAEEEGRFLMSAIFGEDGGS